MTRSERAVMKHDVSVLLDRLGSTPEDVAESLRRAGVRGDPFLVARCPVARYLHAVVGGEPRVGKIKVGLYKAVINGPTWWWPITVALPAPVRLFVLGFDRGRFPELLSQPQGTPANEPEGISEATETPRTVA
jgi:hypothetical protein